MSKKEGKPPGDTTALYRELQTHKDKEDFEKALKVYLKRLETLKFTDIGRI